LSASAKPESTCPRSTSPLGIRVDTTDCDIDSAHPEIDEATSVKLGASRSTAPPTLVMPPPPPVPEGSVTRDHGGE
jgi:hypothetical protein